MTTFDDPDALCAELRRILPKRALVGIDGWTGVGKSTLARYLASESGGRSMEIDHYVGPNEGRYVAALDVDRLRSEVLTSQGILFVDGICLKAAFRAAGLVADVHIYIKRMAVWGWADETELTDPCEIAGSAGEGLREEMRTYHEKWMPQTSATYVYLRQG